MKIYANDDSGLCVDLKLDRKLTDREVRVQVNGPQGVAEVTVLFNEFVQALYSAAGGDGEQAGEEEQLSLELSAEDDDEPSSEPPL